MTILSGWESFYVIVGSSGAALIGLQFVVIALVSDTGARSSTSSIGAFGTPNVVHFAGALYTSAVLSVPWTALLPVAVAVGLAGLCGMGYVALAMRHARAQTVYKPVLEDWLFHTILPLAAYAAMSIAAVFLPSHPAAALYAIGAAALGLLFIGIHNAWDTVTYIVVTSRERAEPRE